MACDCIETADKLLSGRNTRIVQPIMLGEDTMPRALIVTEQVEKGRGKRKHANLFATFCPFCGVRYRPHPMDTGEP